MSGHAKMPLASHQVSAMPLKLLIQQIHPHVRVERNSGICVARDLYELWGRSPYTRVVVARTLESKSGETFITNRNAALSTLLLRKSQGTAFPLFSPLSGDYTFEFELPLCVL